ncbi:MAG: EamA family transporter [Hyphomicrobiales bacterium]
MTQGEFVTFNSRRRATLLGLAAVAMWSTLGLFTAMTGQNGASAGGSANTSVPPFQLNALCFGLAGVLALIILAGQGRLRDVIATTPKALALTVAGLFGYHALYFTALRNAPAVEANLINYLWPLLIVVFSGFLPGERLRWFHGLGAALGFVGAGILIWAQGASFDGRFALGYAAAIGSALAWSSYSVLSRLFPDVPTGAVAGACLITSALSVICHLAFETTVWPASLTGWAGVVALGLFPVGAAFFVWDIGMKRGDIQVLGAAAYATPILSTLLLIAFGFGAFTWPVVAACLLVTLGAVVAAKEMLLR